MNNIIFLKDLVKDSFYAYFFGVNTFIIFKSINNILILIYANENKSIISYNLIYNKKINEIKNAHSGIISKFNYYLDKINKRDLVISITQNDNNIKLWNINNFECLYNFKNINNEGLLISACFLNELNNIYIISSNFLGDSPIKVFDLKGNKIKEIKFSEINFIISYYDIKFSKNYLIINKYYNSLLNDYNENKIYHKYKDNNNNNNFSYNSIIINNKEEIIKLIMSNFKEIRIWNFHSGELLNKINIGNIYDICLWNNEYLLVGCTDKIIKIIELKKGEVIKNLKGHNKGVITIKKIIHPKYGECFISQGYMNDGIKLWVNKY